MDLFSFDDFDLDAPLHTGDTIQVDGQVLSVAGLLKHDYSPMTVSPTAEFPSLPPARPLSGCVLGCIVGLVIGRMLYNLLIDGRFPYAVWVLPVSHLLIVLAFVAVAALAAIYAPAKRIRNMAITATINEL